jgi:TatD DNase family protein
VRFATGIHPHRAGLFAGRASEACDVVRRAVQEAAAIAVGEIGLDYHYDHAPRDVQQAIFAAQLDVAVAIARPVVIHTREAAADTFALLRAAGPTLTGVIHCFTGTLDEARQALDLGFYISISGIATFPRSTALREVAAYVPADRLLIETDAPYLAPVPYRGKRNEPAWVAETCRAIASVRGVAEETLRANLADNVAALLPGLKPVPAR